MTQRTGWGPNERPAEQWARDIDDRVTRRLREAIPDMDHGLTWEESDAEMGIGRNGDTK